MSLDKRESEIGDIGRLLANDEDKDDKLMTQIDNFINNKPINTLGANTVKASSEQIMNMPIKQEDGSGFKTVSALTKRNIKSVPKPKVFMKKKKIKKSIAQFRSKDLTSPNSSLMPTVPVKLEPLSDDEFTEAENTTRGMCSAEKNPVSNKQDYDDQGPSSSGSFKSMLTKLQPEVKAVHGFKLSSTPVVLLEKLDLSRMSLKLTLSDSSEDGPNTPMPSKSSNVGREQHSPSMLRKVDKSLNKKSNSTVKAKPSDQERQPPTAKPDKLKPETASKPVVDKAFLGMGELHLSEPSSSISSFKYELSLSPIVLADLSSEPFRKFMNLALDCAVYFRKNKSQPLFGNICLYFGDLAPLQSAMQRLCQLPVNDHNTGMNGVIKCFDFNKLSKPNDEPGTRSLIGRLMFKFCAQRVEKLQQLVSVKDRKKESRKVCSALIHKVPVALTKEMLLLLFPFSLNVRIEGDNLKHKGLKGPVSVNFESQEWMEAVLDCTRELAVNMSSLSSTELSTFRLYVKNYTPPKISIGTLTVPPKPAIASLTSNQDRGPSRERTRPSEKDRTESVQRNDSTNRDKERAAGGSWQKTHSHSDRKRHNEHRSVSRPNSEEKRRRLDGPGSSNRRMETPPMREMNLTVNQQLPADPKQAIRLAAIARGLDPNNPDVIKILEMSSQLQALQTVMGHGMQPPIQTFGTEPIGQLPFPQLQQEQQQQQLQHLPPREMFRSPASLEKPSNERVTSKSPESRGRFLVCSDQPSSQWGQDQRENTPRHLPFQRGRGLSMENTRGGFIQSPRDTSSFHARRRDSPGTFPLQREESRFRNRSRSPRGSSTPTSSNNTHNRPGSFDQRRGRIEMDARNRGTPIASPGFDPNTNNQPLDFHRPGPTLSTEQAVQQDMARTMQAVWQGDKPERMTPHSFGGKQPLVEELVLPLHFGKNAVKKSPQAILEDKRRKEREERQKQEMELKKKREEEERQKREKEIEERKKRQKEEREKQEKEFEARRKNIGPFFTPGNDWPRPEPQFSDIKRDEFEPYHSPSTTGRFSGNDFLRPNQTPNPFARSGVRFQGEAEKSFQHGTRSPTERPIWTDSTPNMWDAVEKRDKALPRAGHPLMPNRGGSQRGGCSSNVSERGFHQGGPSLRPSFEETKNQQQNIWDAHEANKDVPEMTLDNIFNKEGPAPGPRHRWSEEGAGRGRFKVGKTWDLHGPPSEDVEGGHLSSRLVSPRGGLAVRRSVGGRNLANRGGPNRGSGKWNYTDQESQQEEAGHISGEPPRGRGTVRALLGARGGMRGGVRGRGLGRGQFRFQSEESERQTGFDHPSPDTLNGHESRNTSMGAHPNQSHRPLPPRGPSKSMEEFGVQEGESSSNQRQRGGFQGSVGGLQQNPYLGNNSHSHRGGPVRGHALAGRGRGRQQFVQEEYFEGDWQNTQHNRSGHLEDHSFDGTSGEVAEHALWEQNMDCNVDTRVPKGRGERGRGVASRGRGFSSFGRGFGRDIVTEESLSSDGRDGNYYENTSEFPPGQARNQHGFRAPICQEAPNVPRGRGLRGQAASVSRGAQNRGRAGPSTFRGTGHLRGRGAMRQRTEMTYLEADPDPAQSWDSQYEEFEQQHQSYHHSPGRLADWSPNSGAATPNRNTGNFAGRGAATPNRGGGEFEGRSTFGRGAPTSTRGSANFGGRGMSSFSRGSTSFRGKGALSSNRGSANFEERGASHSIRGSSHFGGRGAARETVDSFNKRALLPTPP